MENENILPRTESMAKEMFHHNIQVEDEVRHNTWRSMCFTLNKEATQFFIQQIIIISLMIFCCNRIIILPSCEGGEWVSFLTFLVGIIIPSPKMKS